ncbi:MAG: hypothetical protein H6Q28_107, partial [Bacteroidetes bacterium]|nr:hypothetical protein [Bacteroidota bacterium]
PATAPAERDAVGAGDVFAAAFMSSLLHSNDEIAAAKAAVAAAGGFAARPAGAEQIRLTGTQ